MPEVKVGIPSVVHAALLPRLIGQAHATAIAVLRQHRRHAGAAWRLVHERCAVGELDAAVQCRADALTR